LQLVAVDEPQGGRVHAVPQPALVARPIRENVAKVAVAVLGANLGPCHAVRAVNVLDDVPGLEGPRETRPSRPAVELVEGCEERLAGNHVDVEARLLVVPVFVGEGALGPAPPRQQAHFRNPCKMGITTQNTNSSSNKMSSKPKAAGRMKSIRFMAAARVLAVRLGYSSICGRKCG